MKKLAVIAVSLFSLASTCGREDTVPPERWRSFEPRLIDTTEYDPCRPVEQQADSIVPRVECGQAAEARSYTCDEVVMTRAEAAKMLATRPACIDRAIRELRREVFADPLAPNDLAAAYYVRAQRENQPLDLLRALEAAEQAIASKHPAAFFNYALIQQTLGFTEEAIAGWDAFLAAEPSSPWANEARQRRDGLLQVQKRDARKRWDAYRAALPAALQRGDRTAVAQLIEPFPRSAWIYFEEEVLGRWADEPTLQHLAEARLYAEELSRRTHDQYPLDAVAALQKPSAGLRKGLSLHRDGIRADRALLRREAAPMFREAATLLEGAGSPVHLSSYYQLQPSEIDPRRYPHLHAQSRALRGFNHFSANQYLKSVNDYEAALQQFIALDDHESATNLLSSTLGMYRVLEQYDLASIAAFRGRDYITRIPDPQRRNRFAGEVSELALALGHPRTALLYQNVNIRKLQDDLASATRKDYREGIRHNLSIALRSRAGVLAALDQFDGALNDLRKAVEYASERSTTDETFRALQARVEEARARALLPRDAAAAIDALTRAIALASEGEYSTFRAQLLVQRATARVRLGQRELAQKDLRDAIGLVRIEQAAQLEKRARGTDEAIWAAYFSRFDDAYDALIHELMEDNRPDEAFAFAEQARAYEPMDLLLNFGTVARNFRSELGPERTLSVAGIQKHLPAGTFVVEYAVLQDRTYAWILGSSHFQVVPLKATRTDVERWSEDLRDAAWYGNEAAFQTGLYAPYAELVATVLTKVRSWTRGPVQLVIIPDGAMHGLPFAALRERASGRYLIQQATVSTAPSATFYVHSLLRDRELPHGGQPSALLFGNPTFDSRLTLAHGLLPLTGAESEVRQIAELYRPRSVTRTGADATVNEFVRLAPQHEIVQVAAHGVVNTRLPFRSALLLAPSAQDDGVMDARTLLTQLRSEQTRLMVFSACSSAGGLPVGAEGVAPLVRPILAAGVPGVVGTLWDINDATSAPLMVSFHRHYRQGSDAAVALQNAQVELLTRDQGNALALTWAPFQVIGYASAPSAVPENKNRGEPP